MKIKLREFTLSLILILGSGVVLADEHQAAAGDEPADQSQEQDVGQDGPVGQDSPGEEGNVAGGNQADVAAEQGLVATLQSNPDFSIFADAVQRAGLTLTLQQEGPFTVLAPTNQAFEEAAIDISSFDQQALTDFVRNHIISGSVGPDQLATLSGVVTLLGSEYAVGSRSGQPVAGAEGVDNQVAGGGAAEQADSEEPGADEPSELDEAQQERAVEEEADAEGDEPGELEAPEDQPEAQPGDDPVQIEPSEPDEAQQERAVEEEADAEADEPGELEAPEDQPEAQPGDDSAQEDADRSMEQPGADGEVSLSIGNASVTHAAIQTSGGVVYGIDTVLAPEGVETNADGGGPGAEPEGEDEPSANDDAGMENDEGEGDGANDSN